MIVVIDPGHGGADPGAIGQGGTKESHVTLAVARLVQKEITTKIPGVEVWLTRTSDVYVSLKDRCKMANQLGADVFVSIHANAAARREVLGCEVFRHPGSAFGLELAKNIHREYMARVSTPDRGVKAANFYVLRYTDMPAALIELDFISNGCGEVMLRADWYQARAAAGITKGILEYRRAV